MRVVPKALSVIFGAVSIALVIAAPLGSFLGGIIGWRNVFNAAAVMGVVCTIWVLKALPSLPGESTSAQQNMFGLLKRPGVMAGMCAIFMAFAGQFAFFTYIRPVYMTLAGFDVDGLTLVLLSFGIASFVGTSLSSMLLKRSVKAALAVAPVVLAISAAVLVLWGRVKSWRRRWPLSGVLPSRWCRLAGQRGSPVPCPIRRRKPGRFRWR